MRENFVRKPDKELEALNFLKDILNGLGSNRLRITKEAIDELHQWRENVEYILNDPQFAPYVVRVCEGGGEEDLIMSLVVSWNKMFNATPAGEYLKPGGGRFS